MSNPVDDFLLGGGAPTASYTAAPIGHTYKGVSLASEVNQQTKMGPGELLFWDDGKPRMQAVVTIQTDLRDPAIQDDDGQRRLFVKGDMQRAVREAVKAAGARSFEVGGTLAVQYVGDGEAKSGLNAPKLYRAQYVAPSPTAATNDLLGVGQPQAQQAVAQAAPLASAAMSSPMAASSSSAAAAPVVDGPLF